MRGLKVLIKKKVTLLLITVMVILSLFAFGGNITNGSYNSTAEYVQNFSLSVNNSSQNHSPPILEDVPTAMHYSNHTKTPYSLPEYSYTNNQADTSKLFHYAGEPAPMGIVDYGLSTTAALGHSYDAFTYSTSEFLGKVKINSLLTLGNASVGNSMSIQLNAMLVFNNSGKQYDYWIQDFAILDTSSKYITLENNIWNSSWPGSYIHNSTISGNGSVHGSTPDQGTYYSDDSMLPGSGVDLKFPAAVSLEVVSFETPTNQPAVSFRYDDGFGWQTYDTVTFKFAHTTLNKGFVVDGNRSTPGRLDYDAEFVLCGPDLGYTTSVVSCNVDLQLEFWNGFNFQAVKNAFDFGSDTSETISNVTVSNEHFTGNGSLFAEVTKGNGSLQEIYNYQDVSILIISSLFPSGTVTIVDQNYNFNQSKLILTLWPGEYTIELTANFLTTHTQWSTAITLSSGEDLSISLPTFSIYDTATIVIFISGVAILATILVIKRRKK